MTTRCVLPNIVKQFSEILNFHFHMSPEVTPVQIKYPKNTVLIPVHQIDVADRSRTDFGNIEELAQSILKKGLIHPSTVTEMPEGSEFPYMLIAGERRKKALEMLGLTEIPCNIREQLARHEVFELELMENFHRKNMIWQEQCVLIAKTHREKCLAKAEDSESWGVRETGYLLGVSAAHVSHATTLSPFLINGDAEIYSCSSMFAAYEVLLKRQENAVAAMLVKDVNTTAARASNALTGIMSTGDDVDDIFDLNGVSTNSMKASALDDFVPSMADKISFDLTKLFFNGDCLTIMPQMADACVDHIVTDPPYGIDVANMAEIKNIETVIDTHDMEQNISMFEPFLTQAFRILRPNGYCVFWYDLSHHEKLQALATKVGFKPQRWPLVWHKLHPCLNNAPRVNFTKNFEVAMVLRKTSGSALVEPQTSSIIAADGAAERKLYDNPFSKPMAIWKFILNAIAYKGQIIFDPYAGQASSLRTVINMGMIPMGCEIDELHYNKGLLNLQKLIKEINGD
jgi:DNA modification methylase